MQTQLDEDLKQLKAAGFVKIAKQYKDMATALRIIHTWAVFQGGVELKPEHVLKMTKKSLARFREGKCESS